MLLWAAAHAADVAPAISADVVAGVYQSTLPGLAVGELLAGGRVALGEQTDAVALVELHQPETAWDIELDLLQLTHTWHPAATLTVGKFYTPLLWWTANVRRGAFHTPPLRAPALVTPEWRSGPLPIHQLGADVVGEVALGPLVGGYGLMVGNGRSPFLGGTSDSGDTDFSKAVLGRVWLRWSALTVGAVMMHDRVLPDAGPRGVGDLLDGSATSRQPVHLEILPGATSITRTITEDLASGHLVWEGDWLEVIAEGLVVRHTTDADISATNRSGYFQAAAQTPAGVPYVRAEHLEMRYGDPLYADIQTVIMDRYALGFRRELSTHLALTGQLRLTDEVHTDTFGIETPETHLDAELQLAVGL